MYSCCMYVHTCVNFMERLNSNQAKNISDILTVQ